MPPTVADATVVTTPPLMEPTTTVRRCRRPPAALPNALSDANAGAAVARRPKTKAVASRYLTPASSKPTSTSISSPAKSPPAPPRTPGSVATDAAAAASGGASTTTTTRTLAVAFQSPTYSLETKSSASASPAAATPELKTKRPAASSAKVSDASQNTYRWPTSFRGTAPPPRRASVDGAAANEYLLHLALSSSDDTDDSASSGGSGSGDVGVAIAPRRSVGSGSGPRRPSPRNNSMSSSARFTRDATTGTRSERFAYPAMPSPAPAPVKKRSLFTGLLSSSPFPFSRASSLKQQQPSPSPAPTSKPVAASAFRRAAAAAAGASSSPFPAPARRSTDEGPAAAAASAGNVKVNRNSSSAGCCGGVDGDVNVKVLKLPAAAAVRAEEEHRLRLLYTRELQWRLVNAQAAAAGSSLALGAEKNLCGAWISVLRVRKSVAIRKMQLQLLRNSCKLMAILRGHMKYLEEWSFLERDQAHSLSGTTEALTATVLRLPVSNGAMSKAIPVHPFSAPLRDRHDTRPHAEAEQRPLYSLASAAEEGGGDGQRAPLPGYSSRSPDPSSSAPWRLEFSDSVATIHPWPGG